MAEQQGSSTASSDHQGNRTMRVRIDESGMTTGYANAFRSHVTSEEVLLDFGLNLPVVVGAPANDGSNEMHFRVSQRVVLSPATVKRLAMALAQVVRDHEARVGEIKLDGGQRQH